MSKKAWAGRFTESNSPLFEKMNRSLGFDIKMFKEDIELNTAYSKELSRIGILSAKDYQTIVAGLAELEKRVSEDMTVAFSTYPTSILELFAVSDAGLLMPPKSTWFEPKLRSGIFLHEF